MAKQREERTRVESNDSAATIAEMHRNWRRRLEMAVGPLKSMNHAVEKAETVAAAHAAKEGRKVGEQ